MLTVPTDMGEVAVHLTGRLPGSAPGLLLLHANPGDHRDFDLIVPTLARKWAVAAVDWPGYGQSTVNHPSMATADGLCDVATRVWDALSAHGFHDVTIIGNSVGGYAALRVAERRPDAVAGLVLVQSAGFTPLNVLTRSMFRVMSNRWFARYAVGLGARSYLGGRGGTRAVYERAARIQKHPERLRVYRAIWRSFADPRLDLRSRAPVIPEIPVQVVWGKYDPMNPWLLNKRGIARALPHAEVAVLAARHEPFCECPELFLDTVTPFLNLRADLST